MSQNASLSPRPTTSLADRQDEIVLRASQRALARHRAVYTEEVRRLLDAGLEVMRQYGTERSPRVSDIVGAAGLSRDAFYRHFESKEDLVATIVEQGARRLVSYLAHQMGKESGPRGQLRRWVEGIMAQASNDDVAHATRAVLWNGGHVADRSRPDLSATSGLLADLVVEPLRALGSADPERDAAVATHAAMGRMQEFLWRSESPGPLDVAHLVRFCTAAAQVAPAAPEPRRH